MDAVLEYLRTKRHPIHEHINVLGRHIFVLPEMVAREQLRPLRRPADPIE